MIRLIASAAFALIVTTSAQATPVAPIHEPDSIISKSWPHAERAEQELMVSAWPEPSNAKLAGCDGMEALACSGTERQSDSGPQRHPSIAA
jgi:hypothetical protein